MTHGPVGVVRQRVDGLDGHHRALKGGHAVEGQRHNQEAQDGIIAQLVPGTRQRHDAVDHATPARRQQDEREHHTHRLGPVWQRGVMQMVRTRPHISEDQGPEVNDGQAVGVDGPLCLLGNEVIHHAQESSGQEETDGVVAVPPLHHGVLHASVGGVRLHAAGRNGRTVHQMQQSHRDDEGPKKPVGHINMANFSGSDGAKKHNGE